MLFAMSSVNQTFPSGPAVTPAGSPPAVGIVKFIIVPDMEIRRIFVSELKSVNQRLPSGPAAIAQGFGFGSGIVNSVTRLLQVPLSQNALGAQVFAQVEPPSTLPVPPFALPATPPEPAAATPPAPPLPATPAPPPPFPA